MKVVIDISEKDYQTVVLRGQVPFVVLDVLRNGTPLPANHGRLIDADELLSHTQDYGEGQSRMMLIDPYYVKNAPTIIEEVKADEVND